MRQKTGSDPIAGEKRAREDNTFGAVLRGKYGEVRVEWKSSDLDTARFKLLERTSKAVKSSAVLQAPGSAAQPIDVESVPETTDGSSQPGVNHMETLPDSVHMMDSNAALPVTALPVSSGDAQKALLQFLAGVTELEMLRIQTSAKLEAENIPFDTSALTSLQILKCLSDDMLAVGTLEALVKPSLLNLDVTGQKLVQPRIESILGSPPLELLTVLNLRKNQLSQLPASVMGHVPLLTDLDVSDNRLTEIPSNLLQLCRYLQVLNLESNKLVVPALDFRDAVLRSLLLGLNNIEYLPTLAPLTSLVQLSLCNLRISKRGPRPDPAVHFDTVPVTAEVVAKPGTPWTRAVPWSVEGERQVRVALGLMCRSSASFHSLVAAFLALLALDDKYRDLLHSTKGAEVGGAGAGTGGLQHILAMCQAGEPVCLDAFVALGRMAQQEEHARALLGMQAADRLLHRAKEPEPITSRYALEALRCLVSANDGIAVQVLKGRPRLRSRDRKSVV